MEKTSIKFVCISDTHTKTHNLTNLEGDVLIHAGDFSSTGHPEEVKNFNSFLGKLNIKHKIVIAGNHDLSFDTLNYESRLKKKFHRYHKNSEHWKSEEIKQGLTNAIYLEDSSIEIFGYKIYGSPWTPFFFDWGFNSDRGKIIRSIWDKIPLDTDILITHGPPHKILDKVEDGSDVGCEELRDVVLNVVKPKYHIFGHIHEGYGIKEEGGVTFINASTCTSRYSPSNKPIIFELPLK